VETQAPEIVKPAPVLDPIPIDVPQSLHPSIRRVWQWSSLFSTIIFAVIVGIPEYLIVRELDRWPVKFPVIGPLVVLLLGLLSWTLSSRQYRMWTYTLREYDLILTWGVFWKTRRCVSRQRVQHIDINSGPLDRRFGLVQVSIYAAGALGGIGSIPGLTPERAEALRAALLETKAADA